MDGLQPHVAAFRAGALVRNPACNPACNAAASTAMVEATAAVTPPDRPTCERQGMETGQAGHETRIVRLETNLAASCMLPSGSRLQAGVTLAHFGIIRAHRACIGWAQPLAYVQVGFAVDPVSGLVMCQQRLVGYQHCVTAAEA